MRNALLAGLLVALVALLLVACGGQSQPMATATAATGVTERDVTYPGVNGVTLAGTLEIPAHRPGKQVPGVIIVAGSGPVDRNGNEPAQGFVTDLYQQIADQLAEQGIASLRYDKRGVGSSTPVPHVANPNNPTPQELAAVQNFAAWDNYVGDAMATLTELQQQPEIDPARTGLIGHSEGAYIVEQVASTSKQLAHPPAAMVVISGPGRPYDVVLREQIANRLKSEHTSADTTAFVLSHYDTIVAGIKATGNTPLDVLLEVEVNPQVPTDMKQLMASLFSLYNDKFWQGAFKVNPVALMKQYPGPVLVLQGASDVQVFANEDTPLLDAALKSRSPDDHETVIVPNTCHNMKFVQHPTDPCTTGPIVPEVASTLRSWLEQKLHATASTRNDLAQKHRRGVPPASAIVGR